VFRAPPLPQSPTLTRALFRFLPQGAIAPRDVPPFLIVLLVLRVSPLHTVTPPLLARPSVHPTLKLPLFPLAVHPLSLEVSVQLSLPHPVKLIHSRVHLRPPVVPRSRGAALRLLRTLRHPAPPLLFPPAPALPPLSVPLPLGLRLIAPRRACPPPGRTLERLV